MSFDPIGLVMSLFEIGVTVYTGHKLRIGKNRHSTAEIIVSAASLICLSLVYQYVNFQYTAFSLLFLGILFNYASRILLTHVFFRFWAKCSHITALYNAMLARILFSASTGFRRMPVIADLDARLAEILRDSFLSGIVSSPVFKNLIYFIIVVVFLKFSGFEKNRSPSHIEIVIFALILFFQTLSIEIIKETFIARNSEYAASGKVMISAFIFLMELFILLLTLFIIRNNNKREENRLLALNTLRNNYEIAGLKDHMASDEQLRAFRHDIKNHLLALSSMAESGGELSTYIDGMLKDVSRAQGRSFYTGNRMLDGLLSMKDASMKEKDIDFTVSLSMKPEAFSSVSDNDLCVVFGNLLDNAIEAAAGAKSEKYVKVTGHPQGAYYCVTFTNSYSGSLKNEGGKLLTTKKDIGIHGFGLSNVQSAVQRSGGIMTVSYDDPEVFTVVVLFPEDVSGEEVSDAL